MSTTANIDPAETIALVENAVFRGEAKYEFSDETKLKGGVLLDTKAGLLDEMHEPMVRLFFKQLAPRPNTVSAALFAMGRETLLEAGRSVHPFLKLSPELMQFRIEAYECLGKAMARDFASGKSFDNVKLACGLYSLSPEEKITIPVLFMLQALGMTFFYQLGVKDPWRYMLSPPSLKIRGEVDFSTNPFVAGAQIMCPDRIMWISREWAANQRPASEYPVWSKEPENSNAVFISDHVRDEFRAVTAAESLRD